MKKFWAKVLSLLALGIVSVGTMMTFAQNTPSGFWDPSSAQGIGITGAWTDQWGKLIDVIKSFINWLLWILALIALVILLRGGFQMVTAAGDDGKYKKGFKILQQAGIGLIFIGVSWLVVSAIFRLLTIIGA